MLTGTDELDAVLEAGPRVFGPDLPVHVRQEIWKSPTLDWYQQAVRLAAQEFVARVHASIALVSKENREIENSQEFKACNGLGYPYYRKPTDLHFWMEDCYGKGCWQNDAFVEDVLKHHPGLRIKVTRGTRGQEYSGKGR